MFTTDNVDTMLYYLYTVYIQNVGRYQLAVQLINDLKGYGFLFFKFLNSENPSPEAASIFLNGRNTDL